MRLGGKQGEDVLSVCDPHSQWTTAQEHLAKVLEANACIGIEATLHRQLSRMVVAW